MKYSREEINSLIVQKQNLLDVVKGGALKFFLCIEILARAKMTAELLKFSLTVVVLAPAFQICRGQLRITAFAISTEVL